MNKLREWTRLVERCMQCTRIKDLSLIIMSGGVEQKNKSVNKIVIVAKALL